MRPMYVLTADAVLHDAVDAVDAQCVHRKHNLQRLAQDADSSACLSN